MYNRLWSWLTYSYLSKPILHWMDISFFPILYKQLISDLLNKACN